MDGQLIYFGRQKRGGGQVDFGNEMDILASLVRTLFEIDDTIYIFRNKIQGCNMMWCKTPLLRLTKGEIYIPSEVILCIYPLSLYPRISNVRLICISSTSRSSRT